MVLSECSIKINWGLMLFCYDFSFYYSLYLAETLTTLILCQTSVHFHNWSQSFHSQSSYVGILKEEFFLIFHRLSCDSCSLPPQKFDGAESADDTQEADPYGNILFSQGPAIERCSLLKDSSPSAPTDEKLPELTGSSTGSSKRHCHLSSLKWRIISY